MVIAFVVPCRVRSPAIVCVASPVASSLMPVETKDALGYFRTSKKSGDFRWPVSLGLSDSSDSASMSMVMRLAVKSPSIGRMLPKNFGKLPACWPSFLVPTNSIVAFSGVSAPGPVGAAGFGDAAESLAADGPAVGTPEADDPAVGPVGGEAVLPAG